MVIVIYQTKNIYKQDWTKYAQNDTMVFQKGGNPMYANASYLNNSILEFTDDSQPLVVGSCGNYRFSGDDLFHTKRPQGRQDYQLIYVASGKAHFTVEGQLHSLPSGNS